MIDFHSHILPQIDDGSSSVEESVQMLEESSRQGITKMVATPHFYVHRNSSVNSFIEKRKKSFDKLYEAIKSRDDVPKITLGAEVKFFNNMSKYDDFERLCIGDTKYMLLEMPFEKWSSRTLVEVQNIIQSGIIPVIAHIERYIDFQKGTENIDELVNMNIPIQMNAEHILGFFSKSKAIKLLKNNIVTLMGSDCHNMSSRKPNLGYAYEVIKKKCGENVVNKICNYADNIINSKI